MLAVTSLAAITLAPIPAHAISFTIGNSTGNTAGGDATDGLTALTFGTQYFAFYPSDISVQNRFSSVDPYLGGELYSAGVVPFAGLDNAFTATFSTTAATPVPFDFEPTGAVVILGGLWGLKRWVNKKRQG